MKRDRQATEARKFLDPRSYVARDGRELLLGIGNLDWIRRKKELWERAGGRCEYIPPSLKQWPEVTGRCGAEGTIPAHIIPRKDITQRDDRMSNLRLYCVEHDRLMERQSWRRVRSDKAERRKVEA
jgi:hypothetical protein